MLTLQRERFRVYNGDKYCLSKSYIIHHHKSSIRTTLELEMTQRGTTIPLILKITLPIMY